MGIITVDFYITDKLLVRNSARQILEKKWEHNKTAYQLFVDFKKAYAWDRREVLYNIYETSYDN
jgi:hypothetical protein